MNNRQELIKLTSEVPPGGSEEETKEAVKQLFRPSIDPDDYYKRLSDEDIKELERQHEEENKRSSS